MHRLKQGMAALALVASLGLIVPSSFGGPASADVYNSDGHNPNMGPTYFFHCDLDGNGTYETEYELASTNNAKGRQVQNSTLVLQVRQLIDVLDSWYEVLDPKSTSPDVSDPDVYWFHGPLSYPQKGWTTVRCTSIASGEYTATAEDAELGLGFVEGELYTEFDLKLWDVTLSQGGQKGKHSK